MTSMPPSGGPPSLPGERRPASVSFRGDSPPAPETDAAMLDPAMQALSDALRVFLRVVIFLMFVMVGLFVFSGLESIKENERGIRLLFGRPAGEDLAPGFQFSAPYPFGEMVKVDTATTTIELDEPFWPGLPEADRAKPIEQLAAARGFGSLKPGTDGSLVTGDQNIAHTTWRIVYRRDKPADFARNVYPEDEKRMVRAAVQRGVVEAVAQITIDDLLKQSANATGSVAQKARVVAQSMLDRAGSGIVIDQLLLKDKIAPLNVYSDFAKVQSAAAEASSAREKAESEAGQTLNAVAGEAASVLITLIDEYERAIERADDAAADATLASINAVFEGREAKAPDGTAIAAGLASGDVTRQINEAVQYRTTVVSQRSAELSRFLAALEQYGSNPELVITRDITDAMSDLTSRPYVQVFYNPSATGTLDVLMNQDIEHVKGRERAAKELANEESMKEREERRKQEKFKTDLQSKPVRGD